MLVVATGPDHNIVTLLSGRIAATHGLTNGRVVVWVKVDPSRFQLRLEFHGILLSSQYGMEFYSDIRRPPESNSRTYRCDVCDQWIGEPPLGDERGARPTGLANCGVVVASEPSRLQFRLELHGNPPFSGWSSGRRVQAHLR
jgi:hypothetical protein